MPSIGSNLFLQMSLNLVFVTLWQRTIDVCVSESLTYSLLIYWPVFIFLSMSFEFVDNRIID